MTSDSRGSGKLGPFGQALPQQIVEVGIAEQNLVGIAAGLAAAGKKSFAVSPACFLTARALEQIKNDVCYSDVPAAIVGISAGVSYGALGSTHHSLHDLAALRAIHNITLIVPADNFETREAVEVCGTVASIPCIFASARRRCTICTARQRNLRSARRSHSARVPTWRSSPRAKRWFTRCSPPSCLAERGMECRVLSMHTIKPLDTDAVILRRPRVPRPLSPSKNIQSTAAWAKRVPPC